MIKTSIRFFEDVPVRAVWNEENFKWYFCAVDICEALTKSKSPRKYWNTLKSRNPELSSICGQLKWVSLLWISTSVKYMAGTVFKESWNCACSVQTYRKLAEIDARISASGQTCGQRRKMGLFNPRNREEQAHYVYLENARFQEI